MPPVLERAPANAAALGSVHAEAAGGVMQAVHAAANALGSEAVDEGGRNASQALEDPEGAAQAARWRSGSATRRVTSMLARVAQSLRAWVNNPGRWPCSSAWACSSATSTIANWCFPTGRCHSTCRCPVVVLAALALEVVNFLHLGDRGVVPSDCGSLDRSSHTLD